MQFGRNLLQFAKIPASSDAETLWHLFQADDKPVWICNGTWWGGDTNETMQLYIAPPAALTSGDATPATYNGNERNAIPVTPAGAFTGGDYTNSNKGCMFGSRNVTIQGFYLPANWVVLMWQDTANTSAWKATIQGFELE